MRANSRDTKDLFRYGHSAVSDESVEDVPYLAKETQLRLALRPYVTTGVAIVGASVIAVTPITPTPAPPQTQTHTVQLSAAVQALDAPSPFPALPNTSAPSQPAAAGLMAGSSFENPITRWIEVFQTTGASLTTLLNAAGTDPFPVIRQIIANQTAYANTISTAVTAAATGVFRWLTVDERANLPASLRLIAQYLAQGNITAIGDQINFALTDLGISLFGLLELLAIPYEMSRNVANVFQTLVSQSLFNTGILGKTGFGLLSTLQTAIRAVTISGQALVDAGRAGDPFAALSAIVNAPAEFIDAVLNGIPNRFGRRVGGLLALTLTGTSWSLGSGLLIHIPRLIAAAITPPAPPAPPAATTTDLSADVAVPPGAGATTISLETGASPTEVTSAEAATDNETGTVTAEEAPEPEAPVSDVADGADETDGTDDLVDTETSKGTEDSEEIGEDATGSGDSDSSETPDDATDLSGGDTEESDDTRPGNTTGNGSRLSSDADADDSDGPATGNTRAGSGNSSSGNDAGGSNGDSDSDSDS